MAPKQDQGADNSTSGVSTTSNVDEQSSASQEAVEHVPKSIATPGRPGMRTISLSTDPANNRFLWDHQPGEPSAKSTAYVPALFGNRATFYSVGTCEVKVSQGIVTVHDRGTTGGWLDDTETPSAPSSSQQGKHENEEGSTRGRTDLVRADSRAPANTGDEGDNSSDS